MYQKTAIMNNTRDSFFAYIIMILLFLSPSVIGNEGGDDVGDHILYRVTEPGAPVITKNKRMTYGLDLVFDTVPGDYWIYYSNNTKKLVIDFYGIHIQGDPEITLSGRGVFRDVAVENYNTNLSLTRRRSAILIGVIPDPGWHFKAVSISRKIIRIIAWKDIAGLTKVKRRRKKVGLYVFLAVLTAIVTGAAIFIFKEL